MPAVASNDFPTASTSERGPCAGEDARDIEKCVRSGRVDRPAVGPLPSPGSGNAGNPAGMTRAGDSLTPRSDALRPSVIRAIVHDYQDGRTPGAIAADRGMNVDVVRAVLREQGFAPRKDREAEKRAAFLARGEAVYRMRLDGWTWARILAAEHVASSVALRNALRAYCETNGLEVPVTDETAARRRKAAHDMIDRAKAMERESAALRRRAEKILLSLRLAP